MLLSGVSRRTLRWRGRDRDDRGSGEDERHPRAFQSTASKRNRRNDCGTSNSQPGKSAESSEESTEVGEVCGCDEWQLDSAIACCRSLDDRRDSYEIILRAAQFKPRETDACEPR
jgi:hypothetical protein